MSRLLFLLLLSNCLLTASRAQEVDSSAVKNEEGFFDGFSVGFPVFHVDYCTPLKSKKAEELPYGLNYLYNRPKHSGGGLITEMNYSFRLLGLFYKDRFGVELYYSGYGTRMDIDPFADYMKKSYPNHNTTAYFENWFYRFEGWRVGLAYKWHIKKFIIEPKVQYGFEVNEDMPGKKRMVETGSNQFIDYSINNELLNKPRSYTAELNLGRRFYLKHKHYTYEMGLHAGYLYAPYHLNIRITEKYYGQPATIHNVDLKDAFRLYYFGIYAAFNFKN